MDFPSFVAFPPESLRKQIPSSVWQSALAQWTELLVAVLSVSDSQLTSLLENDKSIFVFLQSLCGERAIANRTESEAFANPRLWQTAYQVLARLVVVKQATELLTWDFLLDLARVFRKSRTSALYHSLFTGPHTNHIEALALANQRTITRQLEAGIRGNVSILERNLSRLNYLLHASPEACQLYLASDEFVDGLISCFRESMNPSLRDVILATLYLCFIGVSEAKEPKFYMISDRFYTLKAAADAHAAGPVAARDSLVAELITQTPLLELVRQRATARNALSSTLQSRITSLQAYHRKGGRTYRPASHRKSTTTTTSARMPPSSTSSSIPHAHRMSNITQVQDLFPHLGAGFILRLLDEYGDDTEQAIAHVLEGDLPDHLNNRDQGEPLPLPVASSHEIHIPHSPNPVAVSDPESNASLPSRTRTIYDEDMDNIIRNEPSRIHFGKKDQKKTADDILRDKSTGPSKASILSALAQFDWDDDEHDDTYDIDDAGVVLDTTAEDEPEERVPRHLEAVLVHAYQNDPTVFARDANTRRKPARQALRQRTGLTDEALEGWAVMLGRKPKQKRKILSKYSLFDGSQVEIASNRWQKGDEEEDGDSDDGEDGNKDENSRGGEQTMGGGFRGQGFRGNDAGRSRGRGGRQGRGGGGGGERGGRGGRGGGNGGGNSRDDRGGRNANQGQRGKDQSGGPSERGRRGGGSSSSGNSDRGRGGGSDAGRGRGRGKQGKVSRPNRE